MKALVAHAAPLVGAGFKPELRPPAALLAPVINTVTIAPSPAEVGVPVSSSVDATGGAGLTYQWNFGDGLRDEFAVQSLLSPWPVDTAMGTLADEDKLVAGGATFISLQAAQNFGGGAIGGGGGGGGVRPPGPGVAAPGAGQCLRRRRRV